MVIVIVKYFLFDVAYKLGFYIRCTHIAIYFDNTEFLCISSILIYQVWLSEVVTLFLLKMSD